MNEKNIQQALETIARRNVPDNTDLWPRIVRHTGQKDVRLMKMKYSRLVWTILLVLLGLAMVSTVGYALYRFFNDPGLDAVEEAGLASTMQVSTEPTILPAVTSMLPEAGQASELGQSQTIDGITMTLDWVYAENTGFSLDATLEGLPAGQSVGMPIIDFTPPMEQQRRGELLSVMKQGNTMHLLYNTNVVLNGSMFEDSISIIIQIPLLSDSSDEKSTQQIFRFELAAVPVYHGQLHSFYGYEAQSNGISLYLDGLRSDPTHTFAIVCASSSTADDSWNIRTAQLQFGGEEVPGISINEVVEVQEVRALQASEGQHCVQLEFPRGAAPTDRSLRLEMNELIDFEGQPVNGIWRFDVSLPDVQDIPGIAVPTPTPEPTLIAQMAGGMTATLEWAYADASRAAFQFHFDGWQNDYRTFFTTVCDAQNQPLGYGYLQPTEGDNGTFIMTFQPDDATVLQTDEVSLQFDLPVYYMKDPSMQPSEQPLASFHFSLDLPVYPSLKLAPELETTANDISMKLVELVASPSFTEIKLCFQKPSSGIPSDWGIEHSAVLSVDSRQSLFDSYTLLHDADYGLDGSASLPGGAPPSGWRCVELDFPLGHHNQADCLELHIPVLEIMFDGSISQEQLQYAQQQLAKEGMAIDIYSVSGNGGGGAGWVVTQKPEEMEDEQVVQRLMEILGYSHAGPWDFTIEIQLPVRD